MKFTDLKTTRKGAAGEAIARAYFLARECQPFAPDFPGSHVIDFLVWNPKRRTVTAVDVKTYARRYVAPQTGIDKADFVTYAAFESAEGIRVYLLWVDPFERAIYGAYLSDLGEPVASTPGKVYFSLERVTVLRRLTLAEVARLQPISQPERYRGVKRYFSQAAG